MIKKMQIVLRVVNTREGNSERNVSDERDTRRREAGYIRSMYGNISRYEPRERGRNLSDLE